MMNTKKKNTKSKPFLFQVTTIIDEKEFKRFQKFYLNKFKSSLVPKMIIALLAFIALYINIIRGNTNIVILVIAFLIIYPILFTFFIDLQIKKMYRSNKKINMLEEVITFYDDNFTSKSIHNYCTVNYEDIYKVCETKNNFYIFISSNQAFILAKDSLKDVDKFRDFIKLKTEYKLYR